MSKPHTLLRNTKKKNSFQKRFDITCIFEVFLESLIKWRPEAPKNNMSDKFSSHHNLISLSKRARVSSSPHLGAHWMSFDSFISGLSGDYLKSIQTLESRLQILDREHSKVKTCVLVRNQGTSDCHTSSVTLRSLF